MAAFHHPHIPIRSRNFQKKKKMVQAVSPTPALAAGSVRHPKSATTFMPPNQSYIGIVIVRIATMSIHSVVKYRCSFRVLATSPPFCVVEE